MRLIRCLPGHWLILLAGLLPASAAPPPPEAFRVVPLIEQDLREPVDFALTAGGDIWIAERHGRIKRRDAATGKVEIAGELQVIQSGEDGLIGLALDPRFDQTGWIYLYHSKTAVQENHLSRFQVDQGKLMPGSEKVLLRVPADRIPLNHAGGGMTFDREGRLYLSTGDNTHVTEADGYCPIDERPGREFWDAQRTSANTADLRGKILRILPRPDGSYALPEGNLFPPGMAKTRPEIYIMGVRNAFRLSVDPVHGWLYFADVGPDALLPREGRGPAGFDEINLAKKAGNYGWPYCVADNKPYVRYDFAARAPGEPFDPLQLVNRSRNNTGIERLPPAEPALIYYPQVPSTRFPTMGSGGRSAMAGPIVLPSSSQRSGVSLPPFYSGHLFIYDWDRRWIQTVARKADGTPASFHPFLPAQRWKRLVDLEIGPDGALYVLEWGSNWFENRDSRLVRVEYRPVQPE